MPKGEITLVGALSLAQRRLEHEMLHNPNQLPQDTLTKCLIDVWQGANGISLLDEDCPPPTEYSMRLVELLGRTHIIASLK